MTSWFRSVTNFMRAGHAGGSPEDDHPQSQPHQDDAPIPAPTDSRVHRGTLQAKDRTGSVLDIPPPPAPEHMEPMFETFISEMGLKPDKAETLRMLPREHKWRLLYQHYMVSVTKKVEQGTGESKETPDYQCKLIKSEPTAENLATLRVLLQSATVSWVTNFMELKGIPLLYDIIAGNADEDVKAGALKCLRAMMNFQEGLNAVLDHQQSFSIIVRSIRVFQNEILGELSLEHLMVGCRLSPDHYFQVLDAFTTASRGEPRFMCIISSLTRILSLTYRVSCIAFINTIISEAPSEGERREIRNELLQTGLGSALQVVEEDLERRNSEEVSAGDLLTQIGVFKDLWDMDKTLEEQQNQFTIFTQRLLGTKAYKSFEGVINRWMKMPYDQLETEIEFVMNGVVGASFGQLKKAQEETKQAKAEILQLQNKLSALLQSTEGTAPATASATQPGPPELPSAPKPVGKMGARGGRGGHLPSRTPPPPPPGGAGSNTTAAESMTPKSDSEHTQASQLDSFVAESKTNTNVETKPKEVEEAPQKPPAKEVEETPKVDVKAEPVNKSAVAEVPKVEVKAQTVVETPAPIVVAPPPPPPPPGMMGAPPPPPPPPGMMGAPPPPPPPPPGMMGAPPPPPPPPPGMTGAPPPPPPPPPGMMGGPPPPPPPPGMMGGPPPPPGMMAAPARTAKYVGKPKNAMKPLHWTKIPPISVDKTIWRGLSDHNVMLELETLDAQFRSKANTAAPVVSPQRESSKKLLISLLDSKRSNNANIVIQHIKLDAKTIKESLILMQDGLLSEENIKGLIDICPTEEELKTLTSYEGSVDSLGKAEQFLMEMISIPYLTLRLNAYYFRLTAPTKISELRKSVDTITKGCAETKNSKQFSRILEIVLAIGNFMNGGTNRGNCFGFKLSYISELSKIKSVDNKTTLLSFIASLIFKELIDTNQYPNSPLNQLSKQLLHIPLASKITLGQLQSDVSTLQKQVDEMKSQVEKLKEGKLPQDSNARFISRMEEALRDISTQMKDLTESYADMVVAMRNFLMFIGEDAESEEKVIASTEEHFALLAKFMEEWDQACRPIEAQYQPSGKEKKPVNSPQPEKRKVLPQKQAVPAGAEGRLMDSLLVDLKDGNYFKNRIRMQQQRTNS